MSAAGAAGGGGSQGTLWGWGQNEGGALGIGTAAAPICSPVQIGTATNWIVIDLEDFGNYGVGGGDSASIAVNGDGQLFTWGYSEKGMGGRGDSVSVCVPVQVGSETYWKDCTGGYDMWATTTTGTWWYVGGENSQGEAGQGNTTDYSSPVQIGSETYWVKCAGVSGAGFAITNHGSDGGGRLYAVGHNGYGQLGLGDTPARSSPVQVGTDTTWKVVSSSGTDTRAVKTDGTAWAWGHNDEGQLGLGNTTTYSSPVQIGSLTNWKFVTADQRGSSFAIKTDGTAWAWGRNVSGQLGLGDTTVRSSPVQIGSLTDWKTISGSVYCCGATKTDGTLWTWGEGSQGQLGNGTTTDICSPQQVGSDTDWVSIGGSQVSWHQHAIRSV